MLQPGRALMLAALAALYLASRAPLVPLGFGSDADAWTVAANARRLAVDGYRPSRFPGHPLHELVFGGAALMGGPVMAGALNVALSMGVLGVTWRLARAAGQGAAAPLLLLAVHPLFWIASADGSDFMAATLGANAALLAAHNGRATLSGMALGLAVAVRMETAAFAAPLLLLLTRQRRRALLAAALLAAAFYLAPLLYYARHGAPLGDAVTASLSVRQRLMGWALNAWSAAGLLPLAAVTLALVAGRRVLAGLLRARDGLTSAAVLAGALYLLITLLHPSKPSYYLPLLPLLALLATRVAPPFARAALVAAAFSYAFVYPDFVDRTPQGPRPVFRWNNGLLAKDVVARWNAHRAAAVIDRERRPGPQVLALGYWLDPWRWANAQAAPVAELAPGVALDARSNAGWRAADGARMVHKLSAQEAASVRAQGLALAFGEGIDGFLQEAHGYDIRALGAQVVRVRELDASVAERFTLPAMVSCALRGGDWAGCVRAAAGP